MSTVGNKEPVAPDVQLSFGQRFSSAVVGRIDGFFYQYGYALGVHPWRFIFVILVLSGISCLGLWRFHQEQDPANLWVPRGSDFISDTRKLRTEFNVGIRQQSFLVKAPNVLDPDILKKVLNIHNRVLNISTKGGSTWTDLCYSVPVLSFNIKRKRREVILSLGLNDDDENSTEQEDDYNENSTPTELEDNVNESYATMEPEYNDENHVTGTTITYKIKQNQTEDSKMKPNFEDVFEDDLNKSVESLYCNIVDNLKSACYLHNLLDVWKFDSNKLQTLTIEGILKDLNDTLISPTLGHPLTFQYLLGDVSKDKKTGAIVSAGSLLSKYFLSVNYSEANVAESGNSAGTADVADAVGLLWETEFLQIMKNISAEDNNIRLYYQAGRSFADISAMTMFQDIDKLIVGIIIMYIYVQFVLCKYNIVEVRLYLATVGLVGIALAFVVAVGLCSLIGVPYGPVHTALPFLMLGIGVDDVFVIMACWQNLDADEKKKSIPEKMGRALQRAGTSITITSLTNAVAFAVGATTVIPSLQSFCLYAATGILITFLFQATLFTSCLVLDERRVASSSNCVLFCYQHSNYSPNKCSQNITISTTIVEWIYKNIVFSGMGKLSVIIFTFCITAISLQGNLQLEQKFDATWFLPKDSYLYKFQDEVKRSYTDSGIKSAGIYTGRMNYGTEMRNVFNLIEKLKMEKMIVAHVGEWCTEFRQYVDETFEQDILEQPLSEQEFSLYISKFLFTPKGVLYQKKIRFDGELKCGIPAPPIAISSFDLTFHKFKGHEQYVPAMKRVKAIAEGANFTTGEMYATVWSEIFGDWITDEIISTEFYRNMFLACVCVMACTSALIVNLTTCFFIFACVVLTLINVSGMMYYWGLTIDITSCICLQLAAGLCVDYAAHVGHMFLRSSGGTEERALHTMVEIGPAVFSGGISTLIALSVLAGSQSYVFQSFFKIFTLVVLFGLFYGTILLPILLSMFGPEYYKITPTEVVNNENTDKVDKISTLNSVYVLSDHVKEKQLTEDAAHTTPAGTHL